MRTLVLNLALVWFACAAIALVSECAQQNHVQVRLLWDEQVMR